MRGGWVVYEGTIAQGFLCSESLSGNTQFELIVLLYHSIKLFIFIRNLQWEGFGFFPCLLWGFSHWICPCIEVHIQSLVEQFPFWPLSPVRYNTSQILEIELLKHRWKFPHLESLPTIVIYIFLSNIIGTALPFLAMVSYFKENLLACINLLHLFCIV